MRFFCRTSFIITEYQVEENIKTALQKIIITFEHK